MKKPQIIGISILVLIISYLLYFIFLSGLCCDPLQPTNCPGEWKYPAECGKSGDFNPGCQIVGSFRNQPAGKICCDSARTNGECR